jgi:hypothetical protein
MVVHYLKGEYIGESRNANAILEKYHLTSLTLIANTSSISSTKAAHLTLISKKTTRIST